MTDQNQQSSQGQQGSDARPDAQSQQFENSARQPMGESGSDTRLIDQVREHMNVIGADGTHVGTVDSVDGNRIKLTRDDSSDGAHHYLSTGLIAGIENGELRLSADGANAQNFLESE